MSNTASEYDMDMDLWDEYTPDSTPLEMHLSDEEDRYDLQRLKQDDQQRRREDTSGLTDGSDILDYDEVLGPFNRSHRGHTWNPASNCGSLHDPIIEWRNNWDKMTTDPAHEEEMGDICLLMMLHDRLAFHGWDIDDIISKLQETEPFQRQAQRRRFRLRGSCSA